MFSNLSMSTTRTARRLVLLRSITLGVAALLASTAPAQAVGPDAGHAPNYRKANQFTAAELRAFVYDSAVNPTWIGKTDTFWYAYRTADGTNYTKVNPRLGTKEPLFDRAKLGMLLTETLQKPIDPASMPITRLTLNDEATKLKFVLDETQYEYDLTAETLAKLGKAPAQPFGRMGPGGGGGGGGRGRGDGEGRRRDDGEVQNQGEGGGPPGPDGAGPRGPGDRIYSPDRKTYVFARRHNLFLGEVAEKPKEDEKAKAEAKVKADAEAKTKADAEAKTKAEAEAKSKAEAESKAKAEAEKAKTDAEAKTKADTEAKAKAEAEAKAKTEAEAKAKAGPEIAPDEKSDAEAKAKSDAEAKAKTDAEAKAKAEKPKEPEDKVTQLTTDGAEEYSFGGADTDKMARPFGVVWASDSKSFYVVRRDTRTVKELFLVNSLSTPRPTLEKYKYPLPGEEGIHRTELLIYTSAKKALTKVATKWNEEGYSNFHWGKNPDELRFVRIDRPVRHADFCSLNVNTGEVKALISEGFENAPLTLQNMTYLNDTDEMIWWSERSGWGHYYLYTREGKLKNAVTAGNFRAQRISELDVKNRRLYFTANARERGENPNYVHLYGVQLDGTGLALMDPGDANHAARLSPSFQFVVDNSSRIDKAPCTVLRRADGTEVMPLEKADLSRLQATGWKMPETFVVKAADGITDLYGNLWKPFDFDPNRRYPIIVHVYPGPQQEGTTHDFTATAGEQSLAQVGFIVIQVGHRGGSPNRSKAYAAYGYLNLRDYALADKKTSIEQLALIHPYIDIDRVGIYGHSGGGFMTAAALMQKPYNEFFKVGVSSSGNHDNNVYGAYWAERYHGLKEVDAKSAVEKPKEAVAVADAARRDGPPGWEELAYEDEIPIMDGADDGFRLPADEDKAKAAVAEADTLKDKVKEVVKELVKGTKFEIAVPTNAELAANLRGRLLLVHGDMDNNVHPAGTMRLVDALIKANKRFDMLILPGKRHGYADFQPYFTQRMNEYFAEHLLGDFQPGADINEKAAPSTSPR